MSKFSLNIDTLIQGKYELKEVNIAFVFQVNCPGCFIYGFPAMNKLYSQFKNEVGFIGISTAFEDFEFNTKKNTQLLLNEGVIVGETKKYFSTQGVKSYQNIPLFPIAFDRMTKPNDFLTEEHLNNLVELLALSKSLSALELEQASLKQRIVYHYKEYPIIAESFVLNQLRGTPSFIIFKKDLTIKESTFGHQHEQALSQSLQNSLSEIY